MAAHGKPDASQLRQTYVNVMGFLPVQLPGLAVSDCPTCGDPEIVGGETFAGTPDGGAADALPAATAGSARPASRARPTSVFISPSFRSRTRGMMHHPSPLFGTRPSRSARWRTG